MAPPPPPPRDAPQALEVPQELAYLTSLRELRLEYARLDGLPPAVQVCRCCLRLRRRAASVAAGRMVRHGCIVARVLHCGVCPAPQHLPGRAARPGKVSHVVLCIVRTLLFSTQALTRLTRLSLEGNRVAALPLGQYLTGLQALSLANCQLEALPEGLAACSRCSGLMGPHCASHVVLRGWRW